MSEKSWVNPNKSQNTTIIFIQMKLLYVLSKAFMFSNRKKKSYF